MSRWTKMRKRKRVEDAEKRQRIEAYLQMRWDDVTATIKAAKITEEERTMLLERMGSRP